MQKMLPSATMSTTNPISIGLGLNPGDHDEKLETNHLNQGITLHTPRSMYTLTQIHCELGFLLATPIFSAMFTSISYRL